MSSGLSYLKSVNLFAIQISLKTHGCSILSFPNWENCLDMSAHRTECPSSVSAATSRTWTWACMCYVQVTNSASMNVIMLKKKNVCVIELRWHHTSQIFPLQNLRAWVLRLIMWTSLRIMSTNNKRKSWRIWSWNGRWRKLIFISTADWARCLMINFISTADTLRKIRAVKTVSSTYIIQDTAGLI